MPVLAKPDRDIRLTSPTSSWAPSRMPSLWLRLSTPRNTTSSSGPISLRKSPSPFAISLSRPLLRRQRPEVASKVLQGHKECHQLSILLLIGRRANSLIFPVVYSSGPIASLFPPQVALQATSLRASAKAAKMASRIVLKWHESRER